MNEDTLVSKFSKAMMDKIILRQDRYVPMAWSRMDIKRLIFLLKAELVEMEAAELKGMADEAVDIANYAMFIWAMLQWQDETQNENA